MLLLNKRTGTFEWTFEISSSRLSLEIVSLMPLRDVLTECLPTIIELVAEVTLKRVEIGNVFQCGRH